MDRDYVLNYVVNAGAGVATLKQLRTEITGLATDAGAGAAAVDHLNASLQKTGSQQQGAGELKKMNAEAAALAGNAKAAAASVDALGTSVSHAANHVGGLEANLGNLQAGLGASGTAAQGLGTDVMGLVPAWMVFEAGIELARQFGDAVNKSRERLKELGDEAGETRDKMRELGNLDEESGPKDHLVAETVMMGMEGGLMPDDARKYMEQYKGSIEAGRAKHNITPQVEKELAQEGMKFGSRVGLDPATSGDLAAVLSQYSKIDSVEQGAAQLGNITRGLNQGRGKLEPLTRSLLKTAGEVVEEFGGPVANLPQLAAVLGVASMNATPDRAGTKVKEAVRALRHFNVDEDGTPADDQTKTLLDLGIKPGMRYIPSLEKLAPEILKADAEGKGGDVWLQQHGFRNKDEIGSLVQQSRNLQVIKDHADATEDKAEGANVMAKNHEFFTKEKAGVRRLSLAQNAGQQLLIGLEEEMPNLARQAGERSLVNRGYVGPGNKARRTALDGFGALPFLGVKTRAQHEQEHEFMKILRAETKKVGLDPDAEAAKAVQATRPDLAQLLRSPDEQTRANQFEGMFDHDDKGFTREMIRKVMERGGTPFGDGSQIKKRLERVAATSRAQDAAPDDKPTAAVPDVPNRGLFEDVTTPQPKAPRPRGVDPTGKGWGDRVGMGGGSFRGIPLGLLAATAVGAVGAHQREDAPILQDGQFPGNDGGYDARPKTAHVPRKPAPPGSTRDALRDANIARADLQAKARREETQAAIEAASKEQNAKKAVRVKRTMTRVASAVEEQDARRAERAKATEAGMRTADGKGGNDAALMKQLIALQKENNELLRNAGRQLGPLRPGAGPIFPGRK